MSQAGLAAFLRHCRYPHLAEKLKKDLSVNFNVLWSHLFYFIVVPDVLKCVFSILGQLAVGKRLARLSSQWQAACLNDGSAWLKIGSASSAWGFLAEPRQHYLKDTFSQLTRLTLLRVFIAD